jgi:hypothetical protein
MRLALLGAALVLAAAGRATAAPAVSGDYLEARTANVYIGACHAGSEHGTMGREAVLAWHVRDGAWNGTDLAGQKAVVVLAGDENLARDDVKRTSVLYLDKSASPAQRVAMEAMLRARYGKALGAVQNTLAAPITLVESEGSYRLRVGDAVRLDVSKEASRTCCTMPMEVWYQPFVPVQGSRIGYTAMNAFQGAQRMPSWSRVGQNSAIFGAFSVE